MRIAHFCTLDNIGGAARAAFRLHLGLKKLGHESRMFVAQKTSDDPDVIAWDVRLIDRAVRKAKNLAAFVRMRPYENRKPPNSGIFTLDGAGLSKGPAKLAEGFDVVNLHWVANFINVPAFLRRLPKTMPVVWTLHDMNPVTGGCHHSGPCRNFQDQCGRCPFLGSSSCGDISHRNWLKRRRAVSAVGPGRLALVADSTWLQSMSEKSSLYRDFPNSTIHYGLDLETYQPRNREFARQLVGVPADAETVLFVSDWLANPYKGFEFLVEALKKINRPNLILLAVGRKPSPAKLDGLKCRNLPPTDSELMLSTIYSAADMLVIPSRHEAFGQVGIESMACGTPVVGFEVGGIPDFIKPMETGLLARALDTDDLADKIRWMLENPQARVEMGAKGRAMIESEYTLEIQASRYIELYRKLAGNAAV